MEIFCFILGAFIGGIVGFIAVALISVDKK